MPKPKLLVFFLLFLSLSCLAAQELYTSKLLETMEANTQPVDGGSSFDIFLERLKAEHTIQVKNYLAYQAGKRANPFGDEPFLSLSEGIHGYMFVSDINAGLVISAGYKTYHNSYPLIVAMLDNLSGQARYLDSGDVLWKLKLIADMVETASTEQLIDEFVSSSTPQVILIPNVALASAMAVPRYLRFVEKSRSTEAQTAISTIRKVYDVYLQVNGTTEGFTIDQALREARLGESTMKHWKFTVTGNPPRKYIATSTADFAGGAGLQIWYDVNEAKFHGYGVDKIKAP
jgi:type II secretory pathway pseudopilin PulG